MKKKLTPMQIHSAIRKAISDHPEFKEVVIDYDFCKWVRKTKNGYFTVTTTTTCEGSVIGTFTITYTTSNDEYDIHSGFICINSKPEWVINEILNHTDPACFDETTSYNDVAWEIITCPHCGELVDGYNKHEWNELSNKGNPISYECDRCGLNFSVEVK